jgi:hypothetical protein
VGWGVGKGNEGSGRARVDIPLGGRRTDLKLTGRGPELALRRLYLGRGIDGTEIDAQAFLSIDGSRPL